MVFKDAERPFAAANMAEELLKLGGTAVVATNSESLLECVQKLTNGDGGVRHNAIDARSPGRTKDLVISTWGCDDAYSVYGLAAHKAGHD